MSLDLYLYCKKTPSKSAIEKVILPLGFRIEETKGRERPWYFWFEEKDLASVRGCWLYWYKCEAGEEAPRGTKTIFVATTYAGRSYEDLDMQNHVIRQLKKKFGGSVYDPQEGRYGYLQNDIPKLTYPEKRCGFVYLNTRQLIWRIAALPQDVPIEAEKITRFLEEHGLPWFPSEIIQNNVLLPFLVSSLESFLRDFFVAFVDSHPDLLERIYERRGKLEYAALRDLLEGKVSLAEHEANNYSFQNLESANVAFQRYIGVNLFSVWEKRKKFNGKFYIVREVLQELLSLRHRIIHKAYIEPNLGRNETMRYIRFVEYAVDLLSQHLEKEKNFKIDLEKYL